MPGIGGSLSDPKADPKDSIFPHFPGQRPINHGNNPRLILPGSSQYLLCPQNAASLHRGFLSV